MWTAKSPSSVHTFTFTAVDPGARNRVFVDLLLSVVNILSVLQLLMYSDVQPGSDLCCSDS